MNYVILGLTTFIMLVFMSFCIGLFLVTLDIDWGGWLTLPFMIGLFVWLSGNAGVIVYRELESDMIWRKK